MYVWKKIIAKFRWHCISVWSLDNKLWSCQNVWDALLYLLDNICIRYGSNPYRQSVGILMGTDCAPLAVDFFIFCFESYFMISHSDENQADDFSF